MVLIVSWGLAPPAASAQAGEADAGEIAALGGTTFVHGVQPAASGSAGVAFSRYGMALFETTFMPLGQSTIQSWPPRSTVDRSYVYNFGVNFHIRIPVTPRWAPYAIVGGGLLWNTVRQHTFDAQGAPLVVRFDQLNGCLNTGAGVRYYVRPNWGIRSEMKVVISKQIYPQMLMGIFLVIPPD